MQERDRSEGAGRPDHKGGDRGDGCEGFQAASACFSGESRALSQGSEQPLEAGKGVETDFPQSSQEKPGRLSEPCNKEVVVQWLGLHTSNAVATGSIPGQGTKIPLAAWV